MQYSSTVLIAAFGITSIFTHGVLDSVEGANGVTMPGLSVSDGTPRDCASPLCGSEADTSIIRKREMGTNKATALGRTQGGGPVDATKMMAMFMGGGGNATATKEAREVHAANVLRRSLGERAANGGIRTPKGTMETGVKAAAGVGASNGMPTCSDDGKIKMTYHQVNQDGAGPLTAMIDATSGGTDPAAFKSAQVTKNVPGIGIGGLSAAAVMDFPVEVQMPAGMTCSGTVGDAQNVCIVRMQNAAAAGPFGGSVAVTQSPAAKKRAIEYNLSKRHFARALAKRNAEDDAAAAIAELEKIGSATKDEEAEKEAIEGAKSPLTKKSVEDDAAAAIAELEKMGSATKDEEAEKEAIEGAKSPLTKKSVEDDAAAAIAELEKMGSATKDEEAEKEAIEGAKSPLTKKSVEDDAAAAIAELEKMGSATKDEDSKLEPVTVASVTRKRNTEDDANAAAAMAEFDKIDKMIKVESKNSDVVPATKKQADKEADKTSTKTDRDAEEDTELAALDAEIEAEDKE
ncbi:unnamed protein product [Blumeria hordei]|uniref:Egh16H1-like protein n=1 Tax=Blumeria hordei TaxID=2867405 RepID=A0A383UTX3_BLUHO|nr:unnamed protein product [Blumeria hordei]